MKKANQVPEGQRRRQSYRSGHQRWETLLSRTPTQVRLARSLARTTRTRNETETNFPVRVSKADYFPQPPIYPVGSQQGANRDPLANPLGSGRVQMDSP